MLWGLLCCCGKVHDMWQVRLIKFVFCYGYGYAESKTSVTKRKIIIMFLPGSLDFSTSVRGNSRKPQIQRNQFNWFENKKTKIFLCDPNKHFQSTNRPIPQIQKKFTASVQFL